MDMNMQPLRVSASPAYLPGYVVCPTCGYDVYVTKSFTLNPHGMLNGHHVCSASDSPIHEIVHPVEIVSTTVVEEVK